NDGQYLLLPNGELRRWRNAAFSYGPAALVATLDASYYAEPSKLWDPKPLPAASISGTDLTIDPAAGYHGSFVVQATASNALGMATTQFTVTVPDPAPMLGLSDRLMLMPQGTLAVDLAATDADGNPLSYAAQVTGTAQRAYELDQQVGLSYMGSYYTNFQGHNERWL